MIGVIVGVRDVGDVVDEAGYRQLGIARVLDPEDRSALEGMRQTVERRLVAHGVSACEEREEIGHGRDRIHLVIFARHRISRTVRSPD